MPLLKREIDLYPEYLLEEERATQSDWWVMYTMSKQEKKLMRQLVGLNIPFYSPVIERRYRSPNGRLRHSYEPLFSNYVFVCGDETTRYKTVCTGSVSRWLPVEQVDELVSDLRQINRLISTDAPLSPESRLEPGQRVRIRSGPFAGYEGVIVRRDKDVRLQVYVRFMEQGVSVAIDDCQADPI
ncbi:MAG: UpxY family transcription antiterminator [Planctomycetales bacterium]|nr:UpxY family transcription antiterminator [Planctomycetales bacterium]